MLGSRSGRSGAGFDEVRQVHRLVGLQSFENQHGDLELDASCDG